MTKDMETYLKPERLFLSVSIDNGLVARSSSPVREISLCVLWRGIVPCQRCAYDQRAESRANADVRFSSLSYGSDEAVPAEILRGNCLEARNSIGLRHSS